jgi:uncharacterized protein (DUF3084 family)
MKEDYLDSIFKNIKEELDTETPPLGHELRFEEKLKVLNNPDKGTKGNYGPVLRTLLAVAAVAVIALAIFIGLPKNTQGMELASVSNEFSQTQDFFTVAIREELKNVEAQRSPLTEDIIYDGLRQLEKLERQYDKLKLDLAQSQQDNRVVYAMISNFQNRIDILTNLLEQIENVKQLNAKQNEITTTI